MNQIDRSDLLSSEGRLTRLLESHAAYVKPASAACWEIGVQNGELYPARATVEDDWLTLDAPLEVSPVDGGTGDLLMASSRLGPRGKVVLAKGRVHLRRELSLVHETDLGGRLAEALVGFAEAHHIVAGTQRGRAEPVSGARERCREVIDPPDPIGHLAALCEEAGLNAAPGDEELVVKLVSRIGPQSIRLVMSEGCVRASVFIASACSLAASAREALARLSLVMSGIARLTKIVQVADSLDRDVTEAEAWTPRGAGSEDLLAAVSALMATVDHCANEVRAVQREEIANRYLTLATVLPPERSSSLETNCRQTAAW